MIPKPRLIPYPLTLYGIFSQTERIITNKFVKEWGFFKMKRKIISLFTLICLALPIQASAYTFQSLPIASKSKQWYIEIDKSHNSNKQAVQPKQGVYDTYSLLLKNIGNDVQMYPWKYLITHLHLKLPLILLHQITTFQKVIQALTTWYSH